MAWTNGYYYRTWKGRHGYHKYVGGGIVGELAEEHDKQEREELKAKKIAIKEQIADINALEGTMKEQYINIKQLTVAIMEAAGYHQHARSQWRKTRR